MLRRPSLRGLPAKDTQQRTVVRSFYEVAAIASRAVAQPRQSLAFCLVCSYPHGGGLGFDEAGVEGRLRYGGGGVGGAPVEEAAPATLKKKFLGRLIRRAMYLPFSAIVGRRLDESAQADERPLHCDNPDS